MPIFFFLYKQYKAVIFTVLLTITLIAVIFTLVKTNNIVADQRVKIEQQGTQIESLQQQLHDADNVISDMQTENKKLKGDLDSLEDENKALQEEVTDLKKKISIAEEQRKKAELLAAQRQEARATPVSVSRSSLTGRTLSVEASAYIAMCSEGCTGKTATGIDIRNRTPKIIAVDPDVIPLGTVVEIFVDGKSIGQYTAADTGGGINGHEIDILMKTEKQARNFGRQQVDLKIIGKKKLSAV